MSPRGKAKSGASLAASSHETRRCGGALRRVCFALPFNTADHATMGETPSLASRPPDAPPFSRVACPVSPRQTCRGIVDAVEVSRCRCCSNNIDTRHTPSSRHAAFSASNENVRLLIARAVKESGYRHDAPDVATARYRYDIKAMLISRCLRRGGRLPARRDAYARARSAALRADGA